MTDNEIIKGWCKKVLCPPAQEIISRQKAEINELTEGLESLNDEIETYKKANVLIAKQRDERDERLAEIEARNDDLFLKLNGVMHSVDKWLEGEELKQDEVNRAATMREKTLRIVEEQQAEIERYKGVIKILEKDVKTTKSEAIKEFAEKLKTRIKNAVFCCYDVRFKNHLQELLRIIVAMIDNLVKEMTEQ